MNKADNFRGNIYDFKQIRNVDYFVSEFMREKQISGLSIAIVQAPYITKASGYGIADPHFNGEKLVSTTTVFPILRISQAYLSVAIMQLVEKGIISLDDHISKYLNLNSHFSHLVVKDLMNNHSGILSFKKHSKYNAETLYKKEEILQMILDVNDQKLARNKYEISESNGYLLSLLIDQKSGSNYEDFVEDNQFKVLKLQNTFFNKELYKLKEKEIIDDASRHELFKKNSDYINRHELAISDNKSDVLIDPNLRGHADIWTSAYELSVWDIALAGSILIQKPELRAQIYSNDYDEKTHQVIHTRGGWQFSNHPGLMDVYENSNKNYSSYISRFTNSADLICVTLFANKGNLDFTQLARKIATCYKPSLKVGDNLEKYFVNLNNSFEASVTNFEKKLVAESIDFKMDQFKSENFTKFIFDNNGAVIFFNNKDPDEEPYANFDFKESNDFAEKIKRILEASIRVLNY